METTHSKNRRTKKPAPQIVVNEWDDVWRSFRDANEITTIEAMNAEGWKTIRQASLESGYSEKTISAMAVSGKKVDREKKKIIIEGKTREVNFVRPKV